MGHLLVLFAVMFPNLHAYHVDTSRKSYQPLDAYEAEFESQFEPLTEELKIRPIINYGKIRNLMPHTLKLHQEKCCPVTYEPVCASDGITHFNKQCFRCNKESLKTVIIHKGECTEEDIMKLEFAKDPYKKNKFPFPCICPKFENPVCDTDGDTHYNAGCMKCVKPRASISKLGPCDDFVVKK